MGDCGLLNEVIIALQKVGSSGSLTLLCNSCGHSMLVLTFNTFLDFEAE